MQKVYNDKDEIAVPRELIERAAQCIARAETVGAFKGCVVPKVGDKTLAELQHYLTQKES
jgi:hypothetical protein